MGGWQEKPAPGTSLFHTEDQNSVMHFHIIVIVLGAMICYMSDIFKVLDISICGATCTIQIFTYGNTLKLCNKAVQENPEGGVLDIL